MLENHTDQPMASNPSDDNGSRHEHPLSLSERCGPYKCSGCKQFGAKKGYKCQLCPDFILHEPCAELPDDYIHPLYEQEPLTFRADTKLLHYCDACGKSIRGFMFQSYGRASLKLHPLCMTLPPRLSIPGHPRQVFKLFVQGGKYTCKLCSEENKKWKYQCEKTDSKVELDMNCAIVNFYGMSEHGINLVQRPRRVRRAMEKVAGSATGASAAAFIFGAAGFCLNVIQATGA